MSWDFEDPEQTKDILAITATVAVALLRRSGLEQFSINKEQFAEAYDIMPDLRIAPDGEGGAHVSYNGNRHRKQGE